MAVHRFVIKNDLTEGSNIESDGSINEAGVGALSLMAEMDKMEHLYTQAFGDYGAALVKEMRTAAEDTKMILLSHPSTGHEDRKHIDLVFGLWQTLYIVKEQLYSLKSKIEQEKLKRRRSKRLKMVMYGGGGVAAAAVILVCKFARKCRIEEKA